MAILSKYSTHFPSPQFKRELLQYLLVLYVCHVALNRIIMVVGAGRGPLVDASIKAARSTARMVKIFAVEKNPGAVVT